MNSFYRLLEGLHLFFLENNYWPNVSISPTFWLENSDKVTHLRDEGIKIAVNETLIGKFCFIIGRSPVNCLYQRSDDNLESMTAQWGTEAEGDGIIQNLLLGDLQTCTN